MLIINGVRFPEVEFDNFNFDSYSKIATLKTRGKEEFQLTGEEPLPQPEPEPEPQPEPAPGTPDDVVLGPSLTARFNNGISSRSSDAIITVPKGKIYSQRFTTPQDDWNKRVIDIQKHGNGLNISRRMWVSKSPGGAPFDGGDSTRAFGLSLQLYDSGPAYMCNLARGQTYYLNIAHVDSDYPATRCIRSIN